MEDGNTESLEPDLQPRKKPKVQESAKTIWLITYASGSPDITEEIMRSYSIECTECHTITWRESKYTLIHVSRSNKMRSSALQKILTKMRSDHHIIPSAINGYDTLASTIKEDPSFSMEEHPGFKRMIQLLNEKSHEIRSWMQSGTITTNKSGVLWHHINSNDPNSLSRSQLIKRAQRLSIITEEHSELKAAHEALLSAYAAQENEYKKNKAELNIARAQNEDFFNQLCQKITECSDLKRQLIHQARK